MRRLLSLLLLFSLLLLPSCAATEPPKETAAAPKRVAVLFSSLAEAWQDAGGEVAITVRESVERGLVPEGTPLVDGGAGKRIDTERLLSLAPNLVIASADVPAQVAAAELCRAAGIKTLLFHVDTYADYRETLRAMTALTGDTAAMEALTALDGEITALLASPEAAAARGQRIVFIRAGGTAASTKAKLPSDHFAAAMLSELGCRNLAEEAPLLVDTLSIEAILAADPDHLFFSLMGDEAAARANVEALLSRPEWQALRAVREGRVTILSRALFHYKPCLRWAEAYRALIGVFSEEVKE
ncbi:MAG: ABC transporter substrate-binding protein [Clostridia bacterium]|nr:ABC transporter substrate-binding protein [Clostridia bacterium]